MHSEIKVYVLTPKPEIEIPDKNSSPNLDNFLCLANGGMTYGNFTPGEFDESFEQELRDKQSVLAKIPLFIGVHEEIWGDWLSINPVISSDEKTVVFDIGCKAMFMAKLREDRREVKGLFSLSE